MEIVWVYIKNRMLTKELPGKKQRNTKENVYGCCEGGHAGRGGKETDAEDRQRWKRMIKVTPLYIILVWSAMANLHVTNQRSTK